MLSAARGLCSRLPQQGARPRLRASKPHGPTSGITARHVAATSIRDAMESRRAFRAASNGMATASRSEVELQRPFKTARERPSTSNVRSVLALWAPQSCARDRRARRALAVFVQLKRRDGSHSVTARVLSPSHYVCMFRPRAPQCWQCGSRAMGAGATQASARSRPDTAERIERRATHAAAHTLVVTRSTCQARLATNPAAGLRVIALGLLNLGGNRPSCERRCRACSRTLACPPRESRHHFTRRRACRLSAT